MAAAKRRRNGSTDDGRDGSSEGSPRRGPGRPSLGPRKPFLLRLPPDLLEDLRTWSSHELRSLNAHIEYLLRDAVRRRKGAPPD